MNKLKGAEFLLLAINNDRTTGYAFHETWDTGNDKCLDEDKEDSSDDGLGDVDASIEDLEPLDKLEDASDSSESSDSFDEEMDGVSPTWSFRPKATPTLPDLLPAENSISAGPTYSYMWKGASTAIAPFRDDGVEAKALMNWIQNAGGSYPHSASPSIDGLPVADEHTNGMEQAGDEKASISKDGPELATELFKGGEKRSANENVDFEDVKRARNTISGDGMDVELSK